MRISASAHAAGRQGRGADADARRIQRRPRVEGNHVLVDGDARRVERLLGQLARQAARGHVHQQQVIVGAAGHQAEAQPLQFLGQRLGVGDDLGRVGRNSGFSASPKPPPWPR